MLHRSTSKRHAIAGAQPTLLACVLLLISAAPASSAVPLSERLLASPAQALAYCQSGKQPAMSISYINGGLGLVQFGSAKGRAQRVVTAADAATIVNAVVLFHRTVRQCRLATPKLARNLCASGGIPAFDIGYVAGKIDFTIGGPGYHCQTSIATGAIGAAICN